MERNTFLKIAITLLLIMVVFFSLRILSSLDRIRFAQEKLADRLTALETAPPRSEQGPVPPWRDGDFANAEFFDPEAAPGGRLITAIPGDAPIMNPVLASDATGAVFNSLVSASLGERNYLAPQEFQGVLAESWQVSEDHLSYRIKLRDGIYWQNFTDPETGKEWRNVKVTSDDFKFFIEVVKNEKVNCAPLRTLYGTLESVEILNDREFIVNWSEPYYRTLELTLGLAPLPRRLYWNYDGPFDGERFNDDAKRNSMLVGCGPYRLLRYEKNRRAIFVRNDDYIGRYYGAMPSLKYLDFEIVPHPSTSFQMLISGELDQLSLTPDQWMTRTGTPEFAPGGPLHKYRTPRLVYNYIGWNLRRPLFSDAKVRTALTMLVDREKILNDVYHGFGRIVSGPFYIDSPSYDRAVAPLAFDPAAAGKLLAEAGWRDSDGNGILEKDGAEFDVTIIYPVDSPTAERTLAIIREGMAKAGINMRMQAFEWSVMLQKIDRRDFDAGLLGWQMAYEQDPYQLWHSSQADIPSGSNLVGFKNPEADRLIAELRREFDPEKRAAIARQFHRLVHGEQPYTFLIAPDSLAAISSRYRNFRLFPLGLEEKILWTPKPEQLAVPQL